MLATESEYKLNRSRPRDPVASTRISAIASAMYPNNTTETVPVQPELKGSRLVMPSPVCRTGTIFFGARPHPRLYFVNLMYLASDGPDPSVNPVRKPRPRV